MKLFGKGTHSAASDQQSAENFNLKISNKMIDGMSIAKLHALAKRDFIISRICPRDSATEQPALDTTPLHIGDNVHVIAPLGDIEAVAALMGCQVKVAHKKRFF